MREFVKNSPNGQAMSSPDIDLLPTYNHRQLALRNGTDREEIWCAYRGVIYDVSASRLWRTGKHYEHWAGQDLTAELVDAPHADWVFDRFSPVGKLILP